MANILSIVPARWRVLIGALAIAASPAMASPDPALDARPVERERDHRIENPARADVCNAGCPFRDLQRAVRAAPPGGRVLVGPGVNDTCAVIDKPLQLIGLRGPDGERAHLMGGVCWGKGALVVRSRDVVIEGFEISHIELKAGNGACIRLDKGAADVTVRDLDCHDTQVGILGSAKGRLRIEDSRFERGARAHGIYLWFCEDVVLSRVTILSTGKFGHTLKASADHLLIEDSTLAALDSDNSRAADFFGGGKVLIRRSVLQQGPHSDNNDFIGFALEPRRRLPGPHGVRIEDSWLIADRDRARLFRGVALGPLEVVGSRIVGPVESSDMSVDEVGNTDYPSREAAGLPPFDGQSSSLPRAGSMAPLNP